jgi:putative chitinase
MITPELIRAMNPTMPPERAAEIARTLDSAALAAQINTRLRAAAFVSQLAHESGSFRYPEEIWGPTAAQRRYEGRADLGNVQPGDGYRYRGRGWVQLTGRANYRTYGRLVGLHLEGRPELAVQPDAAARIAAAYWTARN